MASSDHLESVDPWSQIRPGFLEPWFENFISGGDADISANPNAIPIMRQDLAPTTPTASASSDPESVQNSGPNPIPIEPQGRGRKRKSRATKRSQTTFITADPANFRQMVQQVTGARGTVLKPEPQKAIGLQAAIGGDCFLPNAEPPMMWRQSQDWRGNFVVAPAAGDGGMAGGLSFDLAREFPTLESWKGV